MNISVYASPLFLLDTMDSLPLNTTGQLRPFDSLVALSVFPRCNVMNISRQSSPCPCLFPLNSCRSRSLDRGTAPHNLKPWNLIMISLTVCACHTTRQKRYRLPSSPTKNQLRDDIPQKGKGDVACTERDRSSQSSLAEDSNILESF